MCGMPSNQLYYSTRSMVAEVRAQYRLPLSSRRVPSAPGFKRDGSDDTNPHVAAACCEHFLQRTSMTNMEAELTPVRNLHIAGAPPPSMPAVIIVLFIPNEVLYIYEYYVQYVEARAFTLPLSRKYFEVRNLNGDVCYLACGLHRSTHIISVHRRARWAGGVW